MKTECGLSGSDLFMQQTVDFGNCNMDVTLPNSPHFRNLVAILLGLTVSAIVVGSVEMLGHTLFPPPGDLELQDQEDVIRMMAEAPVGSLLFVILGWGLGLLCGCLVAGILGGEQNAFCCGVLTLMFTSVVVLMLAQVPSPAWFRFSGILVLIPSGLTGWKISQMLHARWQLLAEPETDPAD